jgi:hypothetical protein
MPLTNNLKKVVDLPIFELCSQAPTATVAASATTTSDEDARYIYYLTGSTFYRYDSYADVWQQLASPNIAPATAVAMKYSTYAGYRGNCLDATTNTMTIAGLSGNIMKGQTIRITAGKGMGQERLISDVTANSLKDQGIVTTATANVITDTTKRWEINQFIGYQVRIIYNTGSSQVRKILYNDATNLYFYDINYQQLEAWNNTPFSAIAPYAVPVATAGSQAHYVIESCDITISTNWDIIPDESSSFVLFSGGVWLLSATASAPWSSFQFYDVLSDTWTTKTAIGGLLLAAMGTDFSIERTGRVGGVYVNGTTTSATTRTLTDTALTGPTAMTIDAYVGYQLRIMSGTGMGQKKRIVSNGTNNFEVASPWITTPDATSVYAVYPDNDKIYLIGNASSQMYIYHVENDEWTTGEEIDCGQARNMAVQYFGQEANAITSAIRNTGGITVLNPTPTAGGTGYAVGDLFNITTGGTVGKGRVEAVSAGGVVTQVSLYSAGLNYTTGAGKATTIISGAGNNGLTVNITTVGVVARVTLVSNCNFYKGDTVTITGSNDAANWDKSYTVLAIDSLNTFDIEITAGASIVNLRTNSVTEIVDSTKNWVVNEHVGKLVILNVAGTSPTTQVRRIISNTATSVTVATITAAANGTSRYTICDPQSFGRDVQWKTPLKSGEGRATGGTATTLVDTTKNWYTNQWLGYRVRILAGTGVGSEVAISANDANTLTLTTPGFTPDTTTKYIIMDTFGTVTAGTTTTLTDTTKNWTVNQWAGKRVVITSGLGQRQELTITSNTANALTFGTATAPDTTSTYTILSLAPRSTGTQLNWAFGTSTIPKGRYLISQRGGATNTIDIYDLVTSTWNITYYMGPQSETFTTGTMTAYDGADTLYIQKDATGRIFAINVNNMSVCGALQLTDLHGAALLGNKMEVITTTDGLTYLYIMQHTGTKMWRALIF